MNTERNPYIDVGARLRGLRESLGYSQKEMADRHGIQRTQWNNWELGVRRISLDQAQRLCAVYGLTLDFIYLGRVDALSESARKLITPK